MRGDVFGATVNIAARVVGHAAAGQVLATERVRDHPDLPGSVTATSRELVQLRHVPDAVVLVELREEHEKHEDLDVVVDPVCQMQVSPTDPGIAHRLHDGESIHFCSDGCARLYAARPEAY